jgi:hydroxymethylglutaryl-CoA lyase
MADNTEVLMGLSRPAGVRYAVLTPNLKGLEGALALPAAYRPDEVVVFGAASEAFSQRNINCSIDESLARFAPVVAAAHDAGLKVRAALSCALGCPYQGAVSADEVERVVVGFKAIGADHIGIADTIGVGTPRAVQAAMERALKHYPLAEVSGHFHDTYGQALANVLACLQMGVHTFDASVAGLGGCPYAKGATGNVATEDLLFMLDGMGIETGVDLNALVDAGAWISGVLGRPPASRVARALLAKRGVAAAPGAHVLQDPAP